jgi:ABC-type Mn2+/Zn2+ transport system ATPase subunit
MEIMRLCSRSARQERAVLMATHDYSLIQQYPARNIRCEERLCPELAEQQYQPYLNIMFVGESVLQQHLSAAFGFRW